MRDVIETSVALPVRLRLHEEPLGLWGTLRAARRNVLEIVPQLALHQPMISAKTATRWHMVMHPRGLRHILRDNVAAYPRSIVSKRILEPGVGNSLFLAEGAEWRWQRRTAAPVFSHRNLVDLAPVMQRAAAATVTRLARHHGGVADLFKEMVAVTFDIISGVTLAGGGEMDSTEVEKAIDAYIHAVARVSIVDLFGAPTWVPRPETMLRPNAARRLHRVADRVVRSRMNNVSGKPDLLDHLKASLDPETGRRMNHLELRDNLLAFIVAGHETTALALSWSLYLLAFDLAAQERAREEVADVLGERDVAGTEDLIKLPFVGAVIDEAMRLYPPVGVIARTAQAEDRICGRVILPGDTIMMPFYALHRHTLYWEEPDAFRPDRFVAQRAGRFTYLPFSDGPRVCIGAGFALMEAKIVLATILKRFSFTSIGHVPKPRLVITLRPEGGVKLAVTDHFEKRGPAGRRRAAA
ncbi:MAG: cytochrome P450 [Pseudomonadota bacterium]